MSAAGGVALDDAVRVFEVSAIALDLDGTLLDTIHDLAAATNALLAELGLAPLPKDTIRTLVGKGMAHLLQRSLALARGVPADAIGDAALADALLKRGIRAGRGRHVEMFEDLRDRLEIRG